MEKLIELVDLLNKDSFTQLSKLDESTRTLLLNELIKLPQFQNTTRFEILDSPACINEDSAIDEVLTFKLVTKEEFHKQNTEYTMTLGNTIEDGKIKSELVTKLVNPPLMFSEVVKIYSIYNSPTVYTEPDGFHELLVSPLTYKPSDFVPQQRIILSISKEKMQDDIAMGKAEEDYKQKLHNLLDQGIEMIERRETNFNMKKHVTIRVSSDSCIKK